MGYSIFFLLIPDLNLPEKIILSVVPLIFLTDIKSYKLQNVIKEFILW